MARAAVFVKLASAHFFCVVACVLVVHASVEPAFAFSSDPAPPTPWGTERAVLGAPLDEYPKPLVDQGYFDHGAGKYVAEDGTVLLWRNGRFENENGDPAHTAEPLKAALREFGVELPDFVVGIGQQKAEQEPHDGQAATDEYLHVAWAGGAATGKTGLKMDVNVNNRVSDMD